MKSWPTANWPALLQGSTKLVSIITLTLLNGDVLKFTDNTEDLKVQGLSGIFTALSGSERSAISFSANLDTSNLDLQFNMNPIQNNTQVNPAQTYVNSAISLYDVLTGIYRGATFELALTFPDHYTDGYMPMLSGILGEVKVGRNTFKVTLESQIFKITVQIPETTTPSCRNQFGDNLCQVNKGALSITTNLSAIANAQQFSIPVVLNNPAIIAAYPGVANIQNVFNHGTIEWTSGANAGLTAEIAYITLQPTSTDIAIWLPVGYPLIVGESVIVFPGCSKQRTNCIAYQNAINMNAEPDLPGITLMTSATTLV